MSCTQWPPAEAVAMMRELYAYTGSTGYVCGSIHTGKPVGKTTFLNAAKKVQKRLDMQPFTIHDFRRTMRTVAQKLGIDHLVGEALIGHVMGKVERTYVQGKMNKRKAKAAQKIADYLCPLMGIHPVAPVQEQTTVDSRPSLYAVA